MKKRIVSVLLCAVIATSIFAGCGNRSDNQSSKKSDAASETPDEDTSDNDASDEEAFNEKVSDEPITVRMMTNLNTEECILENNASWNKLIEGSGINFEYKYTTASTLQEELALSLNSGDYEDVYWRMGFTDAQMMDYGDQGVFLDLKDLILEYAPNLTKLLDENDYWSYIEDVDGHVWSLPVINNPSLGLTNDVVFLNQKYLENLDAEEPKSMDELEALLKRFKEEDANGDGDASDEIPFSIPDWGQMQQALVPYLVNQYDCSTRTAINENGDVYYVPMSEDWKEMLEYLSRWYAEGLINQDFGEIKWADWNSAGRDSDDIGSFARIHAWAYIGADKTMDYIAMKPFEEGTFGTRVPIEIGGLCISDACEDPGRVISLFDYLYSEEGSMLYSVGVEGVTYEFDEDGQLVSLTDGYEDILDMCYHQTLWGNKYGVGLENDEWNTSTMGEERLHNSSERAALIAMGAEPRAKMKFSSEDGDTINSLVTELNSYVGTYTTEVIRGVKDLDSTWDEYVATLKDMGGETLETMYNDAYAQASE